MSLCFLSLESSKVFNKQIFKSLEKSGFDGLTEALINLFPYIAEFKNITASQLANKVGYSRQAMHKHIKKLEDFGYITLSLENQKEKIIKLTPKSEELMIVANDCISQIEKELSQLIGEEELNVFKKNQIKIYDYLLSLD